MLRREALLRPSPLSVPLFPPLPPLWKIAKPSSRDSARLTLRGSQLCSLTRSWAKPIRAPSQTVTTYWEKGRVGEAAPRLRSASESQETPAKDSEPPAQTLKTNTSMHKFLPKCYAESAVQNPNARRPCRSLSLRATATPKRRPSPALLKHLVPHDRLLESVVDAQTAGSVPKAGTPCAASRSRWPTTGRPSASCEGAVARSPCAQPISASDPRLHKPSSRWRALMRARSSAASTPRSRIVSMTAA